MMGCKQNPNSKTLEFESDLTPIALFTNPFPLPFVLPTLPLPAATLRLAILNTLRPLPAAGNVRFRRSMAVGRRLVHVQVVQSVVVLRRWRKQRLGRRRGVEVLWHGSGGAVVWRRRVRGWVGAVESRGGCVCRRGIFRWDPDSAEDHKLWCCCTRLRTWTGSSCVKPIFLFNKINIKWN